MSLSLSLRKNWYGPAESSAECYQENKNLGAPVPGGSRDGGRTQWRQSGDAEMNGYTKLCFAQLVFGL